MAENCRLRSVYLLLSHHFSCMQECTAVLSLGILGRFAMEAQELYAHYGLRRLDERL